MTKKILIAYATWVIVALGSKILFGASWAFALSWLWLPLGLVLSGGILIVGSIKIGDYLKVKKEESIPHDCEHCLFGATRSFTEDGKCLGERLGESDGTKLCKFFRYHQGD